MIGTRFSSPLGIAGRAASFANDREGHVDHASQLGSVRTEQPSQFDRMAAAAVVMSMPRQAMLGALLDGILPCPSNEPADLRPLWANEAMQRAYNMVGLIVELEHRLPFGSPLCAATEYKIATELAALFRSLDVRDTEAVLPCASTLRAIVRTLVRLFGPVVGQVYVRDFIERLEMPAQKRRAMVLAASELMINALRHGFAGRSSGCIAVSLCRTEPSRARLSVADDGCGLPNERVHHCEGTAFDLAEFLESEMTYRRSEGGGTLAEISFSVPHQTRVEPVAAALLSCES